ncbi:MAG: ArsR family transcriptional regulator, partial [Euryarchaeota archaeon]|nr:ArsR family transcriptional regulator [Euryarchaeota archaeon]
MNNRTRIVNDPADLVPLLQVFKSDSHKRVFSSLLNGWRTENELEEMLQEDIYNSLEMLKKIGLIESKWRMPEPGHTPQIEYHTCYSKLRADFQCSISDMSDLIRIAITDDEALRNVADAMECEVKNGNCSVQNLSRTLNQ